MAKVSLNDRTANRLRAIRLKADLSQQEVAEMMGQVTGRVVHRPTYSYLESGNQRITLDNLEEIALSLQVQPHWLLLPEDEWKQVMKDRI